MPILKNPTGENSGEIPGLEPNLNLFVIGDSTVAGLGVSEMTDSLPNQIAVALELYSKRRIIWSSVGKKGLQSENVLDLFESVKDKSHVGMIIFVLGVNDTVKLIPFWKYRNNIRHIIERMKTHFVNADLVFAGIPPLEKFPALFLPLSFALGLWSRSLDVSVKSFARKFKGVYFFNTPVPKPRHYSIDGFHPGRRGYAQWGEFLGRAITIRLKLRVSKKK